MKGLSIIPAIIGFLVAILGTVVIVGWCIEAHKLIRLHDNFSPMQFNTALCHIFAGLALAFLTLHQKSLSCLFGLLLLFIAGFTLSEYIFQFNKGIDEIFMKSYISLSNQFPGRMAPNTALSFTLFAISILLLLWNDPRRRLKLQVGMNLLIISIGILAILGYFTNYATNYGIGQWVQMAVHTAVGLILLSTGLIFYLYTDRGLSYLSLIPLIITFVLLNLTFLSWQQIKKNQELYLNSLLYEKITNVRTLLRTYMVERVAAFSRISNRWLSQEGGTPRQVWESDVLRYIKDQPGYVAIGWVDSHYIVRWVMPKENNEYLVGYNLYLDATQRNVIEQSMKKQEAHLSDQVDLMQGGKGIFLFSPLYRNNQFQGFMIGIMNSQQLFASFIKNIGIAGVNLAIKDTSGHLYSNTKHFNDVTDSAFQRWTKTAIINLYGQNWYIILEPTYEFYHVVISPVLPASTFILGVLVAILAGILTESLLSIRKLQIVAGNANERLQGIIEGSSDYIAAIDLDYNFIVFNTMYHNEVYRLFRIDLKPGMNFSVLAARMSAANRKKTEYLWRKALEGKAYTVIEAFGEKLNSSLHYEIHYNPIFDTEGKLIGASHIATNINERIENEHKLMLYRQELESLVNNLEVQNKSLSLLKEFSSMLQANDSMEQANEIISSYSKKLFGNSSGKLYFIASDDPGCAKATVTWGEPISTVDSFEIDNCLSSLRHQLYHADNTAEDMLCKHVSQCQTIPASYICAPLLVKNEMMGVVYIELGENSLHLQNEISFVQIVCEQIALNLYSIRLKEYLRVQSIRDPLTGLYNRRYFEECIQKEIMLATRYSRSFAVILLDIDHFKMINDTYGHLSGDKALCKLAELLRTELRESDLVARWGGEEFIFIMKGVSLEKIQAKAEKLRQLVENLKIKIDKSHMSFTVSIGIAEFDPAFDKNRLIEKADEALYQAKNTGRNKVVLLS
ncbi:diguanylate cyclase [Legionella dresdenensis]|uniref:diguanylate cyclase n=1 Tax=Legionella dresdenensis TaxID=450200 RepID=A0ABV8CIK5_9GAMM